MSEKLVANNKQNAGRHQSILNLNLQSLSARLPNDLYLWLTLLLSLPILGPLLQPGYFWGAHDARHSVYFLQQFNVAIQDGIWYPRWAPDFAFGYGYPFFNIYGPLSSYTGELLHLAGFDIVTAVKATFGLSAWLSGLTMYLFVRRLLGRPSGLIAALVYVYLPYHIFDLYVRAALAESVSFIFLPLVLWAFVEAVCRPRLPALLWGAAAYAALLLTHPAIGIIFALVSGAYVFYLIVWQFLGTLQANHARPTPASWFHYFAARWRPALTQNRYVLVILTGLPPLFVLLLGIGLSAIALLPAILEAKFVRTDQWFAGRFAFGDDFVEFFQLFSPRWGFGPSIPGPDDETSFQIGLAALVLFMISFSIVPRLADPLLRRTLYFFQGLTIFLLYLTVPLSTPIWKLLPLAQLVQFPWRILAIVAPLISIVAGAVMVGFDQENDQAWPAFPPLPVVILSSLILLASYPYIQAEVRAPKPTEGPVSQAALFRFQQSADELTGQPAWVGRIPNWSTLAEHVTRGGQVTTKVNYAALPDDDSVGVYSMEMDSVHELLWVGTEKKGQAVTFFIPYYPGWQAYILADLGPHDGNLDKAVGPVTRIGPVVERPTIQTTTPEGWMVVPIPAGSHFLEIRFEDTSIRAVGRWISLLSMFSLAGLLFLSRIILKIG